MNRDVQQHAVNPRECVLAFAIPVTLDEYREAQGLPGREFVAGEPWPKYAYQVADPLRKIAKELEGLGVSIETRVTLDRFRTLITRSPRLLILCAHSREQGIELAEGFVSIAAFTEAISPDYDGVIDLCVCNPETLALELRVRQLKCLVRFTNRKATPLLWMHFYRVLLHELARKPMTYLDALERTAAIFQDAGRGDSDDET